MSAQKQTDFVPLIDLSTKEKPKGKSETTEFLTESVWAVSWKKKIFLFAIFLLISSTMFISQVIGKISDSMVRDTTSTTNKGTVVQGIFLVLIYSLMEYLIDNRII